MNISFDERLQLRIEKESGDCGGCDDPLPRPTNVASTSKNSSTNPLASAASRQLRDRSPRSALDIAVPSPDENEDFDLEPSSRVIRRRQNVTGTTGRSNQVESRKTARWIDGALHVDEAADANDGQPTADKVNGLGKSLDDLTLRESPRWLPAGDPSYCGASVEDGQSRAPIGRADEGRYYERKEKNILDVVAVKSRTIEGWCGGGGAGNNAFAGNEQDSKTSRYPAGVTWSALSNFKRTFSKRGIGKAVARLTNKFNRVTSREEVGAGGDGGEEVGGAKSATTWFDVEKYELNRRGLGYPDHSPSSRTCHFNGRTIPLIPENYLEGNDDAANCNDLKQGGNRSNSCLKSKKKMKNKNADRNLKLKIDDPISLPDLETNRSSSVEEPSKKLKKFDLFPRTTTKENSRPSRNIYGEKPDDRNVTDNEFGESDSIIWTKNLTYSRDSIFESMENVGRRDGNVSLESLYGQSLTRIDSTVTGTGVILPDHAGNNRTISLENLTTRSAAPSLVRKASAEDFDISGENASTMRGMALSKSVNFLALQEGCVVVVDDGRWRRGKKFSAQRSPDDVSIPRPIDKPHVSLRRRASLVLKRFKKSVSAFIEPTDDDDDDDDLAENFKNRWTSNDYILNTDESTLYSDRIDSISNLTGPLQLPSDTTKDSDAQKIGKSRDLRIKEQKIIKNKDRKAKVKTRYIFEDKNVNNPGVDGDRTAKFNDINSEGLSRIATSPEYLCFGRGRKLTSSTDTNYGNINTKLDQEMFNENLSNYQTIGSKKKPSDLNAKDKEPRTRSSDKSDEASTDDRSAKICRYNAGDGESDEKVSVDFFKDVCLEGGHLNVGARRRRKNYVTVESNCRVEKELGENEEFAKSILLDEEESFKSSCDKENGDVIEGDTCRKERKILMLCGVVHEDSSDKGNEDMEDEATCYDEANYLISKTKMIRAGVSVPELRSHEDEDVQRKRFLHLMTDELLATERDYIASLAYVIDHYVTEMDKMAAANFPESLRGRKRTIFGNLDLLLNFHAGAFLGALARCKDDPYRLGMEFLKYKQAFNLYSMYSKNKPKSDLLMQEDGAAFFAAKQRELRDKLDLSSYLLKPIQRLSKYALLLKQLVRECPGQHPQYANLKDACAMILFQLQHGNDLLALDYVYNCQVSLREQGDLLRQDLFWVTHRKKKKVPTATLR